MWEGEGSSSALGVAVAVALWAVRLRAERASMGVMRVWEVSLT